MNYKLKNRLVPLLSVCLGMMCTLQGFAQTPNTPRTKKVYSNEDLEKYQEKTQVDPATNQHSTDSDKAQENSSANPGRTSEIPGQKTKMDKGLDKSYWVGQLKQASDKLDKAKFEETKFIGALSTYQKRETEAQTEFDRKTARWQVEDTTKNLARAQEQRKKAEAEKAKVLEEAVKKGFKPEDFKNQEASAVEGTK